MGFRFFAMTRICFCNFNINCAFHNEYVFFRNDSAARFVFSMRQSVFRNAQSFFRNDFDVFRNSVFSAIISVFWAMPTARRKRLPKKVCFRIRVSCRFSSAASIEQVVRRTGTQTHRHTTTHSLNLTNYLGAV